MAKRKRRAHQPRADIPASEPPIQPGLLSPRRTVPREIPRPPYAATGDPGPSRSSSIRTAEEIAAMRRTGQVAAEVLLYVAEQVRPGVTHDQLDALAHDEIVRRGAYPSPLNYRGFPKSICTSANEVICHGIPDSRVLQDGDILNVDVTVYLNGVHGDTSVTFLVGDVDEHSRRLVDETCTALYKGIGAVRPGAPISAIGRAIESHARQFDLGVVREFIGHGVGTEFHSGLQIPHYYDRRASTRMVEGMSFTIEPMLTLGLPELHLWDDEWTALTRDGRRTAQFEHTLLVGAQGAEILTVTASGSSAHDAFRHGVVPR